MLMLRAILIPLLCLCLSAPSGAAILVGQTVGLSGIVAATVKEADLGARLWIDDVNARGGVNGEPIELVQMDDGFDVQRAVNNARVLIQDRAVVAMFMTRGTPHTQALLPLLDRSGVPLVGPSTGAMAFNRPVVRRVFNVRTTYQREAEKAVEHLYTIGLQRVAVVHVADAFGEDALQGVLRGFTRQRREPALVMAADRSAPDHAAITRELLRVDAQAVIWIGSGTAVTAGVAALRQAGSRAQVVTLSNNASDGFIKDLGAFSTGVIVSQVFPNERATAVPLIADITRLARARSAGPITPAMLEGFAAARVLVEGLRRAGPKPTGARVSSALESLGNWDLGGLSVRYSPNAHEGIDFVELSIISDGRFKR